jgi:hypothetical protein
VKSHGLSYVPIHYDRGFQEHPFDQGFASSADQSADWSEWVGEIEFS